MGRGLPLPFLLGHDQPGQVRVQLVLLVDPLLLDAVPALLLGDAQRTGDVVPKIQPLLLGEVIGCGGNKAALRALPPPQGRPSPGRHSPLCRLAMASS